ncbi:MAG: head GIN domain-containing protein [Ferruginibacter sp.]
MKVLLITLLLVISAESFAQKNTEVNDANVVKRTLNASFDAISITDGVSLYLTQGNEESLAVSFSDSKYETRFKTIVDNGTLRIYFDNDGLNWNDNRRRKLKAYVSFKTLSNLSASGGAEVVFNETLILKQVSFKFTSGSLLTGKIKADKMEIAQNSGSQMNLAGNVSDLSIEAGSGAVFSGYGLNADHCSAKASSGASVRISVKQELDAKANSGGAIHYKGEGSIKDINVNSGGVVKRAK